MMRNHNMRRLRYLILLLFVLLSAESICYAVSVEHFSEREGLPNRQTYVIEQDTCGFVWVYTSSGLARYDGKEFRSYELKGLNRSHGYAAFATVIGLNEEGQLYISVNSGQIFQYCPIYDKFERVFDFSEYGMDIRTQNVLFKGQKMLLSTSDGVYLYTPKSLRRVALSGKTVNAILCVDESHFYASTTDGLYYLTAGETGKEWVADAVENTAGISCDKMAIAGGKVFIGSFAHGLFVVRDNSLRAEHAVSAIPDMPMTAVKCYDGKTVYVAVDGAGVYEVNALSETINNRYAYGEESGLLSANTVSDVCNDSSGSLWISTSSHGINRLKLEEPRVSIVRHNKHSSNSLNADCVNAVFRDSDGDMWYGTDGGVSLCRKNGEWQHFLTRANGIDHNIQRIAQAPDGMIYVGGYGSGVYTIDKNSGSVHRLPNRQGNRGIATEYIFEIFCYGNDIWFGGIRGDLTRYDTKNDTYHYYPSECVCDMAIGPKGSLYITGCGGVAIYNPGDSVRWNSEIGGIHIYTYSRDVIYDAARNEMWFATDGQGLIRQNLATGKAQKFEIADTKNKIDNIYGVVLDSKGQIWFNTEQDLYLIGTDRQHAVCVTSLLEVSEVSFVERSIHLDNNQYLSLGTNEGVIIFNTTKGYEDVGDVHLVLNDLLVNYRLCPPGVEDSMIKVSLDKLEKLTLKHQQNTFEIKFSAINFDNSKRVVYDWRLKGYDDEWQNANNRELLFRNVPHGKYTLEIRAKDAITDEIMDERHLIVEIEPPLPLTWWAKMLYVLMVLLTVFLAIKYFRRRQREQRIADKIQSFLSVIHDLRSPITLIKAPLSEIESTEDLPDAVRRNTSLAMTNVDKLLSMIGRLLDLQRESQHSDYLNLTETDLREFLEQKTAEWRVAAIQKGLAIELDIAAALPKVQIDRNKIGHVLDNLLSNAIKYTYQGSITLRARVDKKQWILEISDTGIGIPRNDRSLLFRSQYRGSNVVSTDEIGSGMGLLIVHRLCALHKCKIKLTSKENEGTTFKLVFPLHIRAVSFKMPDSDEREDTEYAESIDESKATLVLIDDEKDILDYLQEVLSDTYNVLRYYEAEEALKHISEINPDIVLSDVKLKGMSGFELCQKVKSSVETSHIPVILLSAMSERQNIILGLEYGANDYIIKPFDISVLRLRIRNILDSRRLMQSHVIANEEQDDNIDMINDLDKEFMENVRAAIDANISDSEYSIGNLCRDLGMSRTTIYNKIKALTGESINEFIRIRRLTQAKSLLLSHRYSISEVAYMVGFADPKYFSTCFKKVFGVSPSKAE